MILHFPARILITIFIFFIVVVIILAIIGGAFKVASDGSDDPAKYLDKDIE